MPKPVIWKSLTETIVKITVVTFYIAAIFAALIGGYIWGRIEGHHNAIDQRNQWRSTYLEDIPPNRPNTTGQWPPTAFRETHRINQAR